MDKVTTALIATEDNAAAIRTLGSSLRSQTDKNSAAIDSLTSELEVRTTNKFITATAVSSFMTFGAIASDGTQCVIITFDETSKRTIFYGGKQIGAFTSPAVIVLPKGNGSLLVSGITAARALLLAGITVSITK